MHERTWQVKLDIVDVLVSVVNQMERVCEKLLGAVISLHLLEPKVSETDHYLYVHSFSPKLFGQLSCLQRRGHCNQDRVTNQHTRIKGHLKCLETYIAYYQAYHHQRYIRYGYRRYKLCSCRNSIFLQPEVLSRSRHEMAYPCAKFTSGSHSYNLSSELPTRNWL